MNQDFRDLFAEFNAGRVEFLIVGAHALAVHGHVRATRDLDVWVCPEPENARRVLRALKSFDAPTLDLTVDDLSHPDLIFQMGVPPMRIDVLSRMIAAVALALLWPGASQAAASPANSTIPSHVLMVGLREGVPDTTVGAFTIVARDLNNTPDAGKLIEFRILLCPAARLATDQLQPGVSTRCATHGVTAITDVNGMVRFAVVGGSEAKGLHGMGPCAQVYSGGVALGGVRIAYLDLDGSGGMGANDVSVWLSDFGTGEPIGRSDFNGDQTLTVDDLSVWLQIWADGRQVESPAAYCP